MTEKNLLIIIIILSAVVGYQFYKLYTKRREDIIKLVVRRDSLPAPTSGTTWIQQGVCYMKDGKIGRVEGNECVSIQVL